MRKITILLAVLMVFTLAGCAKEANAALDKIKDNTLSTSKAKDSNAAKTDEKDSKESKTDANKKLEWPVEYSKWDVPVIKNAVLTFSDNRSVGKQGFATGINAVVTLDKLPKKDLEDYFAVLVKKGFVHNAEESLKDTIYVYEKTITGGLIKMMVVCSGDVTTITLNNSTAEAQKNEAAGGKVNWPSSLSGVPEFSKGKFKETIDMGGGMYVISYIGVKSSDVDDYAKKLVSAGFEKADKEDTEGYIKKSPKIIYSVGFMLEGDTLQIMGMSQAY